MSIRSHVVGVSVAATLATAAPAQQNAPNPATELPAGLAQVIRDFDRTAAAAVKNPADISYALGVVTRDGLAWSGSYGFTDAGRQSVATADTAYHAGTSALTSIMLLQLMHDGIVHLSDQVTTYVPEIASVRRPYPRASSVSLMQLATHTSGLSLDEADVRAAAGVSAGSWEARLIAALPYATYSFEPGTHAEASRLNDGLLALALSRAAHQTYADYRCA
jgi:CubicO group peptidase (beta-lactamase class C family)